MKKILFKINYLFIILLTISCSKKEDIGKNDSVSQVDDSFIAQNTIQTESQAYNAQSNGYWVEVLTKDEVISETLLLGNVPQSTIDTLILELPNVIYHYLVFENSKFKEYLSFVDGIDPIQTLQLDVNILTDEFEIFDPVNNQILATLHLINNVFTHDDSYLYVDAEIPFDQTNNIVIGNNNPEAPWWLDALCQSACRVAHSAMGLDEELDSICCFFL